MKSPVIIIAILFLVAFALVNHFASLTFSSEAVVLTTTEAPKIMMLGTQSCKYCYIARDFFNTHQLPFVEHDIEASDKHLQMFYLLGGQGTPLIIVNGQVIPGFDEAAIRRSL